MSHAAGLIGAGRVGRNHAEALRNAAGIELGAIAEVDPELRDELGDEWGINPERRYETHVALLDAEEVDALSIATPGHLHYRHVLDALDAPTPPSVLWCEKPIATRVSHAREMYRRCEERDVELLVNHTRRFAGAYRTLRELLHDDGLLGEIESVHVAAGGTLLNMGTHYVDLVLYLLDARATRVSGGYLDEHDHWAGTVSLESGAIVTFGCTRGAIPMDQLRLVGTEGALVAPLSVATDQPHEWRYWRIEDGQPVEHDLPAPLDERWEEDIAGTHATYEPGMVPAQNTFDATAEHVHDVLAGRTTPTAGAQAVHGLEILAGVTVSHATGASVDVPLPAPLETLDL